MVGIGWTDSGGKRNEEWAEMGNISQQKEAFVMDFFRRLNERVDNNTKVADSQGGPDGAAASVQLECSNVPRHNQELCFVVELLKFCRPNLFFIS